MKKMMGKNRFWNCEASEAFLNKPSVSVAIFIVQVVLFGFSLPISAATVELWDQKSLQAKGGSNIGSDNEKDYMIQELQNVMEGFIRQNNLNRARKSTTRLIKEGVQKLRTGDQKKGIELIMRAWDLEPNNYKIGVILAMSYFHDTDYENALKITKRMQEIHSPDQKNQIVGYQFEGVIHLYNNKKKLSKKAFNHVLSLEPGDPYASDKLAVFAIQENAFEDARSLYNEVLLYHPGQKSAVVALAKLEIDSGNFQVAEILLQKSIVQYPEDKIFTILLAKSYFISNQVNKVFELTEPALIRFPESSALRGLLGAAYLYQDNSAKAIVQLKAAIEINPKNSNYRYNLALAYEQQQAFELALEEVSVLLKLNPESIKLQFFKIRLLSANNNMTAADAALSTLSKSHPENPAIMELAGRLALLKNQNQKALLLFEKALNIEASESLVLNLAFSQMRAGAIDSGFDTLVDGQKQFPDSIKIQIAIADTLFSQGKKRQAKDQYAEIVTKQPANVDALNNLAWLLLQEGQTQDAYKYASKALQIAPENIDVASTYAIVMLRQGQAKKAQILLSRLVNKSPNDLSLQYYWAEALFENKEQKKARQILENLLTSKKIFTERQKAQQLLKKLN